MNGLINSLSQSEDKKYLEEGLGFGPTENGTQLDRGGDYSPGQR